MSKKITLVLLLAVLTALVLCGCGLSAAPGEEETPVPEMTTVPTATPEPTAAPVRLTLGDQSEHPALLSLDESGYFQAFRRVSRMTVCESLYEVLDGWRMGMVRFGDLDPAQPGYAAASALCLSGFYPVTAGGDFSPNKEVSRDEFAQLLELAAQHLSGEDAQRAQTLAEEVRSGALVPEGMADTLISRGEFAQVMVRLTGRELNEAALLTGGYIPGDLDTETNGWMYMTDAVIEGVPQAPAAGVYRVDGVLYGVGADGQLLRDTDYGVWTFDADGRYTTGDKELDDFIRQALEECGANELSDWEALKAAYLHVKYNYQYLVTPADMVTEEPGATGWENERALRFFQNGGGTCYGFTAAFGLLARSLGQRAYIVSAQVNEYYAPHGFVVIPENGVDWIYDVEMEATRQERHKDFALFGIRNFSVYSYWYTPDW